MRIKDVLGHEQPRGWTEDQKWLTSQRHSCQHTSTTSQGWLMSRWCNQQIVFEKLLHGHPHPEFRYVRNSEWEEGLSAMGVCREPRWPLHRCCLNQGDTGPWGLGRQNQGMITGSSDSPDVVRGWTRARGHPPREDSQEQTVILTFFSDIEKIQTHQIKDTNNTIICSRK